MGLDRLECGSNNLRYCFDSLCQMVQKGRNIACKKTKKENIFYTITLTYFIFSLEE